jgi:hypothetical protein
MFAASVGWDRWLEVRMSVEILVAAGSAVLVGVFSFTYAEYDFYLSWVRLRLWLVFYILFLLVNGASGWLGWRIGRALTWHPYTSAWGSGLAYGLLGEAVVRAQFNRMPRADTENELSALGKLSAWLKGMLDHWVKKSVTRRLSNLEPRPLATYLMAICDTDVARDNDLPEPVKKLYGRQIKAHARGLKSEDEDTSGDARRQLLKLGLEWIPKYKSPAPVRVVPASSCTT